MTMYMYKARNPQGDLVSGTMDMESETHVATHLDQLGYSVLEVSLPPKEGTSPIRQLIERFERLDKQEVIIFTRQLATLMRSGMPLLPSLETICQQTTNKKFKAIMEDIYQSVQGGESFSEALAKYPQAFSDLFVSMVRVGETGGIMDQVLDRLGVLGTQEMEISSRIRAAMTYPVVLVVMAFFIVNFIMVGVLPKFVMVFSASKAPLPLPTQIVLGMSWIIRRFWLLIIAVFAAAFFYFRRYTRTEKGKFQFHQWLVKVPIFGDLYLKVQISRFTRTLSTLTASGVPILQALTVVENTISNVVLQRAIQGIRTAITAGSSLVEPFKASGLFSPMVVQMISIGERSGNIDKMLEDVSKFYDPEIEYTIKNLTSLLEPFMLLTMGGMVAFIAMSVLLPIFNLMKVFRT